MDFLQPRNSTCSAGFRMFLRVLVSSPTTLGFYSSSPAVKLSEVDLSSFGLRGVPILIRCGTQLKADVYECVVANTSEMAALKVFNSLSSFNNESSVYRSDGGNHRTRLLQHWHNTQIGCLLVTPFATSSLADQPFSQHLFNGACSAASKTLRELHDKKLVYLDPSPSNGLVYETKDNKVACVWNDFGEVQPAGIKLPAFAGTHVYASLNLAPLALGRAPLYEYSLIDDWQAMFFTLLQYAYTRRLLPRDSGLATTKTDIWSGKLLCHDIKYVQGMVEENVNPSAQSTLLALYDAVFVKKNTEAAHSALLAATKDQYSQQADPLVWMGKSVFHTQKSCGGFTCNEQIPLSRANDLLRMTECKRCADR